jgi:hypothetical protein
MTIFPVIWQAVKGGKYVALQALAHEDGHIGHLDYSVKAE